MRRRLVLPAVLLALAPGVAGACGDEEPRTLSGPDLARFDYGIRLSIACRRADVRLRELPRARSARDSLRVASQWRAEALRLHRDLRAERYEGFLRVRAGDLHAASDALKGSLGALNRALRGTLERERPVDELAGGIVASGERLRAAGTALDANACRRVGADAERRLLPALRRYARVL